MTASRLSLLAAALLLAPPVLAKETRTRYRLVAMGDSLTDTRVGGGKFLAYLAKQCPQSRFESKGKGGQMVNQMRRRFARDVLGKDHSHVLVFGGVNDLYSDETAGRTVAKIIGDLSAMYKAARAGGLRVIALTVAPWGGFKHFTPRRAEATRQLNAWILQQKAEGKVDAVLATGPVLSCGDDDRLCAGLGSKDGLHLTDAGHEKLGEALHRQVFSDCRLRQDGPEAQLGDALDLGARSAKLGGGVVLNPPSERLKDRRLGVVPHGDDEREPVPFHVGRVEALEGLPLLVAQRIQGSAGLLGA